LSALACKALPFIQYVASKIKMKNAYPKIDTLANIELLSRLSRQPITSLRISNENKAAKLQSDRLIHFAGS
jgi:hypothetical protein